MADIELVVKVSEEDYLTFSELSEKEKVNELTYYERMIANGTPLPKGHGELKDTDVMISKLCTHEASELFGSTTCAEILDFINSEKPIIEADKGSGDK